MLSFSQEFVLLTFIGISLVLTEVICITENIGIQKNVCFKSHFYHSEILFTMWHVLPSLSNS